MAHIDNYYINKDPSIISSAQHIIKLYVKNKINISVFVYYNINFNVKFFIKIDILNSKYAI